MQIKLRKMSTKAPEVYFVVSIFISFVSARKGITTEIFMNRKFVCQSMTKKVFSVRSEIQCYHRCLREEKCEALNFNTENEARENCEVFNDGKKCTSKITMDGWKAIEFQQQRPPKVYESCKEIYNDRPTSLTGVYNLASGEHFCYMGNDISPCGTGGWTLTLKMDGSKNTFLGSASYWTNTNVYNTDKGIESFYENEAKFPAFNEVAFEDICIGMKVGSDINWLRIPGVRQESMLSLLKPGTEISTSVNRATWKALVGSSSLQLNCNRQGFNIKDKPDGRMLTRIGYVANQEADCLSCDSFIGIGSLVWPISCGNYASGSTSPDNGGKNTPAMCYVLVK